MGRSHIAQTRMNGRHHSINLGQDLIIPETQHSVAVRIEESSAFGVGCDGLSLAVLAAIHFNDDAFLVTREVDEVGTDRRLPTEMGAFGRQPAQMPPELSLGLGHGAAKRASARHTGVGLARL